MNTLVIAEHNNTVLQPATLNTLGAAAQLGQPITVLVAGKGCLAIANHLACIPKVTQILLAEAAAYEYGLAENLAPLIVNLAKPFTHILAPATSFGKNVLPRVAAMLDMAQVSDVIDILSLNTFNRPIYAGNAIATVQVNEPIKVLTIRSTAFKPVSFEQTPLAEIKIVDTQFATNQVNFIKRDAIKTARPELTAARIVIAGGRGMQSKENFQLLEKIAERLGAAIGATRAAVDAGFAPNDYQIGQTGKIVAPDLYIAVGISGAIQHLAGMKESKVIVAINKDPDAPIFQIADYGLVGDLFEILPHLESRLTQILSH